MTENKTHINQSDNYKKNFGIAYRSSTIFYFKKSKKFSTLINFMDYWTVKKSMKVMVIASLRDLRGNLVLREKLNFDKGHVINYSPNIEDEEFEGSLKWKQFVMTTLESPLQRC